MLLVSMKTGGFLPLFSKKMLYICFDLDYCLKTRLVGDICIEDIIIDN
jgi:hypothetical protein